MLLDYDLFEECVDNCGTTDLPVDSIIDTVDMPPDLSPVITSEDLPPEDSPLPQPDDTPIDPHPPKSNNH